MLKEHNGARRDGAVASFATQDKRADILYAGLVRLRELGYRLDSVVLKVMIKLVKWPRLCSKALDSPADCLPILPSSGMIPILKSEAPRCGSLDLMRCLH